MQSLKGGNFLIDPRTAIICIFKAQDQSQKESCKHGMVKAFSKIA